MSKGTFNILGDIVANDSERWFESDIVPGMVIGWLAKQDGDIEININSNGGDVAGGLAIANAIKGYTKGKKTCNVLGVAASMASVVACAGDELKMGQGAFLMVHNPWTVTAGNAEELRKDADTLDNIARHKLSHDIIVTLSEHTT
jgi:ATP-dependent protease ClpP protease subunit